MVSFFSRIHSLKLFNRLTIATIVCIYLVILAGIFVRVTDSGMGCPDWPKCYGLLIPPTNIDQLNWNPNQEYSKGQMVIKEVDGSPALFKSKYFFTSSSKWKDLNWEQLNDSKHNYSDFSPFKTWTEYLNRCLGAISGIFIMTLVLVSFFGKKIPTNLFFVSFLLIFLSLIQYWLGRNVVYSLLQSQKITIHFFVALIFIPTLFFLFYQSNYYLHKKSLLTNSYSDKRCNQKEEPVINNKYALVFKNFATKLLLIALIFSIIQMFFGTQVRGQVQEGLITHLYSIELMFHRLFVPFIFAINIILFLGFRIVFKNQINGRKVDLEMIGLVCVLCLLLLTGFWMYFFEIFNSIQPTWTTLIHAYSAVFLFSIYVSLLLKRFIYRSN